MPYAQIMFFTEGAVEYVGDRASLFTSNSIIHKLLPLAWTMRKHMHLGSVSDTRVFLD